MSRVPLRRPRKIDAANFYDAFGKDERVKPTLAPELRGHSQGTLAEARKTRGSVDGNMGPRAMTLAGYEESLDGGEGVFVWDPTSTEADDEGVTTIAVFEVTNGRWKRSQLYPDQYGQLLRAPQVITSGTTFAPLIPGRPALVEVLGGGGGSGGAANSLAGQISIAMSGGSGAYARRYYTSLPASCTISIGAGGTAGANTPTSGGVGGGTTFSDGTTTVTAPGGSGGPAATGGAASGATPWIARGAAGAILATNGNLNQQGRPAEPSIRLDGTVGWTGNGGSSVLGPGARGINATVGTSAGEAAPANSGGGASGGLSVNAGGAVAGAVGGGGLIVVWEF